MNTIKKLLSLFRKKKPEQKTIVEKPKKVRQRFNNKTGGAFGKCRTSRMMQDMRVYPRSKVKQAIEEMMK